MIGKVSVMSNRLRSFLIVVMSIVVVMAALPMNAFRVNADGFLLYYDGNGGTYTVNTSTYTIYSKTPDDKGEVTVDDNSAVGFIREGYVFAGWNEKSDGKGVTYTPNVTKFNLTDLNKNVTIYAQWTKVCSITFVPDFPDGATVISNSMETQTVLEGQSASLNGNQFSCEGYLFIGWKDDAGKGYEDNGNITVSDNVTLHAQWKEACTVTFNANNGTGGTDTQVVPKNEATTLSSVSSLGFTAPTLTPAVSFIGWSLGAEDKTIKYTDTEKVTLSADTNLFAQWAETTVITFAAGATDATGTMGTQTVGRGYETTLLANGFKRTGYNFKGWSKTPGATTADYTTTINLASDAEATLTLYAVWEKKTYTVEFYDENGTTKLTEISVPYEETPTSTPNPTKAPDDTKVYTFAGWSLKDDDTNTIVNPLPTVTADVAYKAVYSDQTRYYSVNVSSSIPGVGTVSGSGTSYEFDQNATLKAELSADEISNGYYFVKWKNYIDATISEQATYVYQVKKDIFWTAEFSNEYKVNFSCYPAGSATLTGGNAYVFGGTAQLSVTPNEGYYITGWTKDGVIVNDKNDSYSFSIDKTNGEEYNVVVNLDNQYTYTTVASPAVGGTVSDGGSTTYGTAVSLNATPNTENGYHFVNWSDGTNTWTTQELSYTVKSTATLTATFANTYVITANPDESSHGSVSGGNTYTYGDPVTLTATPNTADGYYFVGWKKDGADISNTNPVLTFTLDASDHNYVAVFNNEYNVSVVSSNTAHGSVSGNATKTFGEEATVEAVPETGYHFVNWTVNGTEVSASATYAFTVKEDVKLQANFAIDRHTVLFVNEDGTVLQSEVLEYGMTPVYTKATPTKPRTQQYSYTFAGWDKEITTVTADKTYTATYSSTINYYTVKYVNDDGSVLQEGQFAYGTNAYYQQKATPTKKPTAQFTYTFAGWDNKVTLVTDDVTYTATYDYTINKYKVTFVNEDGSVLQTGELEYGKMPVYEKDTPTKASTVQETFTFAGWDKEISKVTGETVYTATYTAKAITKDDVNYKHFTVTFETNGGSEVVAQLVAEGGVAFKPEEPMRERYTFGGWYVDAALTKPFSFATVITSDITLYAKWIKGSQDVDATYAIVGSGSMSWSTGSGEDITVAVERSKENDSIATHFKGVQIDGAELEYYNYELTDDNSGVIIRADALEGLAVGSHTITILYDDGKAEVELVIADANKPAETGEETTATEAGGGEIVNITTEKSNYLGLWIALAIVAGVVIAAFPIFIIKRRSLK